MGKNPEQYKPPRNSRHEEMIEGKGVCLCACVWAVGSERWD